MKLMAVRALLRRFWVAGFVATLMAACGGGGGGGGAADPAPPSVTPPAADARLDYGNAPFQTVLNALPVAPPASSGGGATPTTLTIHYKRTNADYTGWTLHAFDAAVETTWTNGITPSSTDSFGKVFEVPLRANSGSVGYIFHNGDTKDHGNADQRYTLAPGRNEIWRIEGDSATYSSNPSGAARPDISTVRVHYKRYAADYANWGLHLWAANGIDTSRVPAGVTIDQWASPVQFAQMPGYAAAADEVVFDIPVLNPTGDAARMALEFIIHGNAPNSDDKDGRSNNIRVDFASLTLSNRVGQVWLVQGDPVVYLAAPDTRSASTRDARAVWLNKTLLKWPFNTSSGTVKIYHSAAGQILAAKDAAVTGADGAITLDAFTGTVPTAAAERFRWVNAGAVFAVKAADQSRMATLHKSQLVLVQENASGLVQNSTTVQLAGALDELYAAANTVTDLGVAISGGSTRFKL